MGLGLVILFIIGHLMCLIPSIWAKHLPGVHRGRLYPDMKTVFAMSVYVDRLTGK